MPLWIENKPLAETGAGERCTDGAFGASALALGALPPSAREVLVSLFSAYSLHQGLTQRAVFVSVFARGCQLHELVSEEEHGRSAVAGTKSWSAHGLLPGISSRKRCIRHEVLFETIMREVTRYGVKSVGGDDGMLLSYLIFADSCNIISSRFDEMRANLANSASHTCSNRLFFAGL